MMYKVEIEYKICINLTIDRYVYILGIVEFLSY